MKLPQILVWAPITESMHKLTSTLTRRGYICIIVSSEEELAKSQSGDLLLIDSNRDSLSGYVLKDLIQRTKREQHVLVILLADEESLPDIEKDTNVDDFVLKPYTHNELAVRVERLLLRERKLAVEPTEYLRSGDLVIDLPKCEVTIAGRVIDLTFTEYELLKLLVSQKGSVLTREVLLNKIWGYDYFGGDRTVDVHITRLRSKIEDTDHNLIETVRNVGYRFRENER
jgi:DNA-binding response OmpR family regulator